MASSSRSSSRERDALVKHQHSFPESPLSPTRKPVPINKHEMETLQKVTMPLTSRLRLNRWDSSDPERAPPPLPLNPNPGSPSTRTGASPNIAAAARQIEERARENAPSPYTMNPPPPKSSSPERSLIKGAAHKRMQSLQDVNIRDFRNFLNPTRSAGTSPERPGSRTSTSGLGDGLSSPPTSPDKGSSLVSTPTPAERGFLKDTPHLRPSSRSNHKAILGENTPPSATYMALQSMPVRDFESPLFETTNGATPRPKQEQPDLSNQIRDIATIAQNLQHEMAQLSRRSKDNATDLISLKEATNSRDEDIRKSLKELSHNLNAFSVFTPPQAPGLHSRSNSFGGFNSGPGTPPPGDKGGFRLPRMTTPYHDDRSVSPNPYSIEGAASVAMLEKIIREMVTKEGQERLITNLNTLFEKANQESSEAAKKVGELVEFIKSGSDSHALTFRDTSNGDQSSGPNAGAVARATRELKSAGFAPQADANSSKPYSAKGPSGDFVSNDMIKMMKKIHESVTKSGGITAEVKALVRDLRGEVLGMGRELGRKIDEMTPNSSRALAIEDGEEKEDVAAIVRDAMAELQEQMQQLLHHRRRDSLASSAVSNDEVHAVVKHALAGQHEGEAPLNKEAIIEAVKEAYDSSKPQFEFQQFGLERDDILDCLREGLDQYRSSMAASHHQISREEVMDAVLEAMQHVEIPQAAIETQEIREEVISAVRECLDEFKPSMQVAPPAQPQLDPQVAHGLLLEAVRQGFETHGASAAQEARLSRDEMIEALSRARQDGLELDISREDLFEAVKAGLDNITLPPVQVNYGDQVLQLQDLVDHMRAEFKAYSSANGRDTEQVLDAMKDGMEALREEIERYVDRAQDVTGKDEIIDSLRAGLENLRSDVQNYVAAGPQGDQSLNRHEMLEYIRSEFEHLHESMSNQIVPAAKNDNQEVLSVLNDGFESLKAEMVKRAEEDSTKEEVEEAMKAEFEQLRDSVLSGTASQRDEILDTIHASLDGLHNKLDARDVDSRSIQSNDDMLTLFKDEFGHLREVLASTIVKADSGSHGEIVDTIREQMEAIRTQITSDQGESSKETQGTIKEELEHLRETLGGTLVKSGSFEQKEEILDTLRTGFEGMREAQIQTANAGLSEEFLQALNETLEQLRSSIAGGVARRADTDEIHETLRLGLDDLRSHLDKKIDNPERSMSATGEILDALNDGVESLRSEINNIEPKPMDMSVNYEILETLKDGIRTITTEITRLKGDKKATVEDDISAVGNEVVLADDPESALSRDSHVDVERPAGRPAAGVARDDLKGLEVMMTQLKIKVEAMDDNMQNFPAPSAVPEGVALKDDLDSVVGKVVDKDDLAGLDAKLEGLNANLEEFFAGMDFKHDLAEISEVLKDLQAAVVVLSEDKKRDIDIIDGVAKKEDTDAIETLVQNTKAKLDDFGDPESLAKKEHLDIIEAGVIDVSDALGKLSEKISGEEVASKGDVALVEVLVGEIKSGVEELKAALPSNDEKAQDAKKEHIDAVSVAISELSAKVATLPDSESVPTKVEHEQLVGLINDLREGYDKLKDAYENDINVTAKAFDDRKTESDTIIAKVGEVREFLEAVKEEIQTKLAEGGEGVDGVKDTLKTLEEDIGAKYNVTADVKELMETLNREFERAHGSIEELKTDSESKATASLEKHDEVKDAIINGLTEKLEAKFAELMNKNDDMLVIAESQAQKLDEKTAQQEELMTSAKGMTEDLKVTIDTLGTTVTAMDSTLKETAEKFNSESAVVSQGLTDMVAKIDEGQEDNRGEHEATREEISHSHEENIKEHESTRDEIAKALTALTAMQDDLTENHPKFLVTLQEVLALAHQQKEAQDEAKAAAEAAKEEEKTRSEQLKESFFAGLPALLPSPESTEKFDDTSLQEKLDRLLGHAAEAERVGETLEYLQDIQRQVSNTAAEISEFVKHQTRLITEGHENREKESEEIALLIERRLCQKEQIEQDIHYLNGEKDHIRHVVEGLRSDKEYLMAQKSRLKADIAAMEMAGDLRRQEIKIFEARAEEMHRSMVEGIIDMSRAMMLNNGKRVVRRPRDSKEIAEDATAMPPPSAAAKNIAFAMNRPTAKRQSMGLPVDPANRRIFSLSQIDPNSRSPKSAGHGLSGLPNTGLKRSHSVKTNFGLGGAGRKVSWGSVKQQRAVSDLANKENDILSEEEEDIGTEIEHSDGGSTQRRHSIVTGSEIASSYDERSEYTRDLEDISPGTDGDRRSSYLAGSEYTYGSSYITDSEAGGESHVTSRGPRTEGDERSSIYSGGDVSDDDVEDDFQDATETDAGDENDKSFTPTPGDAPATTASTATTSAPAAVDREVIDDESSTKHDESMTAVDEVDTAAPKTTMPLSKDSSASPSPPPPEIDAETRMAQLDKDMSMSELDGDDSVDATPATVAAAEMTASGGKKTPPQPIVTTGYNNNHVASDSGLGSEIPTAGIVPSGMADYFRRAAEEESSCVSSNCASGVTVEGTETEVGK
ncbi:uncharacterized protein IWZ02DRAFT_53007 [Phyllosticta citriasiana]|uniref:uncharacterized protein n=1 Tax=Phyllosticta citriasiana TaxID=595635 RepID=UPI0030FD2C83